MVFEKVAKILAEIIGMDDQDITPETALTREYGITALDVAKLVIECERKFRITIQDEDVHAFRYVSDLTDYIEMRLKHE